MIPKPSRTQGYIPKSRGPQSPKSHTPKSPKSSGPQSRGIQSRGIQSRGIQSRGIQSRGIQSRGIQSQLQSNETGLVPMIEVKTEMIGAQIFGQDDLIINEKSLREPYRRRMKELKKSIHWGQRKLLLSEIEFFTLYWDPNLIPAPLCVYAGSAPGTHIPLLSTMFPAFTFHLYDPSPFKIQSSDRISLYNEYFTDEVAQKYQNRTDVFFISDIRTIGYKEVMREELDKRGVLKTLEERGLTHFDAEASNIPSDLVGIVKQASKATADRIETQIWKDMEMQQNWVLIMNPVEALLKFRLPYVYNGDRIVPYLKGTVFWQTWAPQTSVETRLKPIKNAKGVYELADWSILEYEEWNFHHNSTIRENVTFLNPFTHTEKPISEPELLSDYDSTSEAYILMLYYQKTGLSDPDVIYPKVIKLSELITRNLNLGYNGSKIKTLSIKRTTTNKLFVRAFDPFKSKTQISKPHPSSQNFEFSNVILTSVPSTSSKTIIPSNPPSTNLPSLSSNLTPNLPPTSINPSLPLLTPEVVAVKPLLPTLTPGGPETKKNPMTPPKLMTAPKLMTTPKLGTPLLPSLTTKAPELPLLTKKAPELPQLTTGSMMGSKLPGRMSGGRPVLVQGGLMVPKMQGMSGQVMAPKLTLDGGSMEAPKLVGLGRGRK